MDYKQATYMLTVLQEGNITNAAKKLYVSQPSLSQMIKLIETNLGMPIFNRKTDPISLTFAGEKYIEAAKQIISINNNLEKEIQEIDNEDYGTLRLGIPVQRAMQVIPYLMPKFKKAYPHVVMHIEEHGSTTTERLLMEGNVDLACLTTTPHLADLTYDLVETEQIVLLAGINSSFAKKIAPGTTIDITDAKDESFISLKAGHSVRAIQDQLFIENHIQPDIYFETISIEVGKRAAIADNAVLLCPLNYIYMSPDLLDMCAIYPVNGIQSTRNFYVCHRNDLYLTKYMKFFIKLLTAHDKPFIPTITR